MGKGNFTEEFKRDAVAQIIERGYPLAEVSKRLGVSVEKRSRKAARQGHETAKSRLAEVKD